MKYPRNCARSRASDFVGSASRTVYSAAPESVRSADPTRIAQNYFVWIVASVACLCLVQPVAQSATNLLSNERKQAKNFGDQFFVAPRQWTWADKMIDARNNPCFTGSLEWYLGLSHTDAIDAWISRDVAGIWQAKHPKVKPTYDALYGHGGYGGGFEAEIMGKWFDADSKDAAIERSFIDQALAGMRQDYRAFPEFSQPLVRQYADLCRENPSTDDVRWWRLYENIHRLCDKLAPLAGNDSIPQSVAALSSTFGAGFEIRSETIASEMQALDARKSATAAALSRDASDPQVDSFVHDYLNFRSKIWFGNGAVQVYIKANAAVDLRAEWKAQLINLHDDLENKIWFKSVASSTLRAESLVLDSDRDPADIVLRRTQALLAQLQASGDATTIRRLGSLASELAGLADNVKTIQPEEIDARYALYFDLCRMRREIAFANPLLNFNSLLFIKRHYIAPELGFPFFTTQGCYALGGGGLFVLDQPFGQTPAVHDLLKGKVCQSGRMKGQTLETGSVLSPELSYDGKTILFAYTEVPPQRQRYISQKQDPTLWANYTWTPETCYHIFCINADGTGLRQLSDGSFNDTYPCWLPDGRIVFTSDRRGGFTRSRWSYAPGHTLHRMNADGTNIVRLSSHMNQEWAPAVGHDGRLLYTRYDYWDRAYTSGLGCWSSTPDGRDARAVSGNYKGDKNSIATEMDVQPVPGSGKLFATASPSVFGPDFGALAIIDPTVPEERQGNRYPVPFKRLTPELRIPYVEESRSGGRLDYATARPLSEDFWLCVYDGANNSYNGPANNYGVYLMDSFGNKELLYRDPQISCLTPIPLAARPVPRVIPEQGVLSDDPVRDTTSGTETGTVGMINIYESALPFPKDVKITALRVWAIVPKSTPIKDRPRVRFGENSGPRTCLGVVPVETDGSAYFTQPANIPVYYQALDSDGCAVQSMRTDTYVHRGESQTCTGCHQEATDANRIRDQFPLAMKRSPSTISPEPQGANPFSYARLVQPVLDVKCVACHESDPTAKAPDLTPGDWKRDPDRFFTSARSLYPFLAKSTAVYNSHLGQPDLTVPGEFGARASKLHQMLVQGHHDVKLTTEEMRRLVVWMDSQATIFGSDRDIEGQNQGKIVKPDFNPVNDTATDREYVKGTIDWLNAKWIISLKDITGYGTTTADAIESGPGFAALAVAANGQPTPMSFGRSALFPRPSYLDVEHSLYWDQDFAMASVAKQATYVLLHQQLRNVERQPSIALDTIEPLNIGFADASKAWKTVRPGGSLPAIALLTGDGPDDYGVYCCLEWPGLGGYVDFKNGRLIAGIHVHGMRVNPGEIVPVPRVHLIFFRGGLAQLQKALGFYLNSGNVFSSSLASYGANALDHSIPRNYKQFPIFAHRINEEGAALDLAIGRPSAGTVVLGDLLGAIQLTTPANQWTGDACKAGFEALSGVESAQHLLDQAATDALPADALKAGWMAKMYVAPQKNEAFILVRSDHEGGNQTLIVASLNDTATYQAFDGWGTRALAAATGAAFARDGLILTLPPDSVRTLHFEIVPKP